MATDPPIGTKIRRARERKRMSQEELAEAVGVHRVTVSQWEADRAYPRNRIGALEEVLGISLEDEDRPRFKPVSDNLRREIAEVLGDDIEAQRYVIGVLEGTLSRPEADDAPSQERPGRSAR